MPASRFTSSDVSSLWRGRWSIDCLRSIRWREILSPSLGWRGEAFSWQLMSSIKIQKTSGPAMTRWLCLICMYEVMWLEINFVFINVALMYEWIYCYFTLSAVRFQTNFDITLDNQSYSALILSFKDESSISTTKTPPQFLTHGEVILIILLCVLVPLAIIVSMVITYFICVVSFTLFISQFYLWTYEVLWMKSIIPTISNYFYIFNFLFSVARQREEVPLSRFWTLPLQTP